MMADQDVQNGLPNGWVACSIGQVTLPVSKIDPRKNPNREIDYIDISSIDNARQIVGDVKRHRIAEAPSRARQIVLSGDVLFATVRPYLRNIASVPKHHDRQIASTGFSILRPATGISPAFLYYKATSQDFVNALSRMQYGVSYPAVKDEQVRDQPLWLPPSAEQRRIASKIEELFSELDKGVESLITARAQLKVYRQAVLKHAFEGKLTAQWREENKDKLETAEQLLARIKRERTAYHETALEEWKRALTAWHANDGKGRKPVKPKRPIWTIETNRSALREIPTGWRYVPFGVLAIKIRNGISMRPDEKGPLKIFRISAVRPMAFDLQDCRRITDIDGRFQGYRLSYGDLVFTRYSGSRDYVGVSAMYRGDGSHVYPDKLIRCEIKSEVLEPAYLEAATNSGESRAFIEKRIRTTAGQSGISGGDIKTMPVPICSYLEQAEIVRILEEKFKVTEAIESQIEAALVDAEVLRRSILRKAFSGELVEQVPSDEPASVLLERIKSEQASQKPKTKPRKRQVASA